MKKLMILGGARYALPVIRAAHDLGIYVITCDYLPDNIAHKYSDEYCNVSIIDKDAVLEAARKLEIDGITSFACDPGVVTAAYVAEKMGLPSCGSYESVSILQNKVRFRKFLEDNGFTVPRSGGYTDAEAAMNDLDKYDWPVIVKPTDSAGSKGVTKVTDPDQLRDAIDYALKFSHNGEFIIEEFITKKGYSSDSDSFSVDGKLKFVSFDSQRFDSKAENPYTPSAYTWPSSMSKEHEEELASELQRLISLLNMGTSIYNIETRESTDGKAYIMECSPRGGGNRLAEVLEFATGVNLIGNVVRAAVGMPLVEIEQKPYKGHWAEVILHSSKPGVFDSISIDESIRDEVVEEDLWIEPGTAVGGFSAANEAIGTLVLNFADDAKLQKVMDNIDEYVTINLKG